MKSSILLVGRPVAHQTGREGCRKLWGPYDSTIEDDEHWLRQRLAGTVLLEVHESGRWADRRYLAERSMALQGRTAAWDSG